MVSIRRSEKRSSGEYFTETGRLAIDSQTGYIVAYIPGSTEKEAVVAGLKARFYKDC